MKRVFETPQKPRFWTHRARPWILGCPQMVKKWPKSGQKVVKKWSKNGAQKSHTFLTKNTDFSLALKTQKWAKNELKMT